MTLARSSLILFRIALAVALAITIFLATTQEAFPVLENTNDKINHILAFYVLALLADYSAPRTRFTLIKGLMILGFGLLIEVIQHFLPYREFSFFDLIADGIGIVVYALSQPVLGHIGILRQR